MQHASQAAKKYFFYELIHVSKKSKARVGKIHTPHGIIETPNFVPVGTNGTLKALDNKLIDMLMQYPSNVQLMFCNTFHLMLHPGTEIVASAGGLHSYIKRNGPIITDSGGFQVFSLAQSAHIAQLKEQGTFLEEMKELKGQHFRADMMENLVKSVTEEGVRFKSYRDGKEVFLTPESSVDAQKQLGADIIIPFDELLPHSVSHERLVASLERTHRWEKRSLDRHLANPQQQAMYAVVHGGTHRELRQQSIDYLSGLPFDGYAVGGSLGANREEMMQLLDFVLPQLPQEKPNHILGIADLESVKQFISKGVDTFDSAYPTRLGRHGNLFHSKKGSISIRSMTEHLTNVHEPIDKDCPCHVCQNYSLSYLHHLFKTKEPTYGILGSLHNVHFLTNMMHKIRQQILNDEI